MSEEEQYSPSEDASGEPEESDPDGEPLSAVPPSEFLFVYLRQSTDSLSVTQSDLEDLLMAEPQIWILTTASVQSREILEEMLIWTVETLGTVRNQKLLLLRIRKEEQTERYHQISQISTGGYNSTVIISACVIRFHHKRTKQVRQQAHPVLFADISESEVLAVVYDDRYHTGYEEQLSPNLKRDITNITPIGSLLNETTEQIIVSNQTGTIIDYSLKDDETVLAAVTDKSTNTDPTSASDAISSNLMPTTWLRTQGHRIGIGFATIALAGLLIFNAVPISLSTPITNGIGLIALGVLVSVMLHSDLTNG